MLVEKIIVLSFFWISGRLLFSDWLFEAVNGFFIDVEIANISLSVETSSDKWFW